MSVLKCEARRAEQPGVVATLSAHNLDASGRNRKRAFKNLLVHVFPKQIPTV